ncbi:MAG: 50S ribosomal protein L31 [Brevinema sp.]
MKQGIHPNVQNTKVVCSCGNTFQIRSTVSDMVVEVCSQCHPFYTGQSRNTERGGMVERFKNRYNINKK